jgi:hypothetical protein
VTQLPPYWSSTKPWFGPRRRARDTLAHRTDLLPPGQTLERIRDMVGDKFSAIQEVRFIDFVHRDEDFRYTISLLWTLSSQSARQALYEHADSIVRATGWYPLVQGERLGSALALDELRRQVPR